MSIHGKALNNKYAIVFGIAGGYYLRHYPVKCVS